MASALFPFQFLLAIAAGIVQRSQLRVIEYLVEENRVLKAQIGRRRLRLSDDDRARLACKGKALGRKLLERYAAIVTPDTILRWHRELIARKWTYAQTPSGRPRVLRAIEELAVRMARENRTWGYERIQGALANLGHRVARTTVAKILARHGLPPAPRRRTTWRQFLRSQRAVIAAADFFTTEVWTARGLVTVFALFAIRLRSRRVEILGSTTHPDEAFMGQIARNVTSEPSPVFDGVRFLIVDRDAKFTAHFRKILRDSGIRLIRTPPRAPQCNAFAERWVRSVKSECLDRIVPIGIGSVHRALREYFAHYNHERNHQGIGNRIIEPGEDVGRAAGRVVRRARLGGLLSFYRREAG